MALVAVTDVLSTMLGHATPAKGEKLQSDVIVSTENLVSRQLILCRVALEDFFPVLRQLWLTPTPGSQHRGGQTLRGRGEQVTWTIHARKLPKPYEYFFVSRLIPSIKSR